MMKRQLPGLPVGRGTLPAGILSMRNEGAPSMADFQQAIEAVNLAFKAYTDKADAEIEDLRKGVSDVVRTEELIKLNDELTGLQGTVDQMNQQLAAAVIGGGDNVADPDLANYSAGFDRYFRRGVDQGLRDLEIKLELSTDSDPDGGYTAPVEVATAIDSTLLEISQMRGIAQVISIGAKAYQKLVNLHGATSGWVGERESRTETSTPTLSRLDFPAMELYAEPHVTAGLLEDSAINIGAWLADEVGMEFAQEEGAAFVTGDGDNKPRGFLDYDTVADASYAWGSLGFIATGASGAFKTTAEGDDVDNLIDLVYALKAGYRANARFIMNRATLGVVRKMKDGDGNHHWQPSMQAGQPSSLLGFGITEAEDMPAIAANSLSVAFGDFRRGYLIVDRAGIRVLRDPYTSKPYIKFYTTKRVGGGVQNFEAIKLLKFAA